MFADGLLHDLNVSFDLVIAGVSVDFTCDMDGLFCGQHDITAGE